MILGVSGATNYDFNCGTRSFFRGTCAPFPTITLASQIRVTRIGKPQLEFMEMIQPEIAVSVHLAAVSPYTIDFSEYMSGINISCVDTMLRMKIDFPGKQQLWLPCTSVNEGNTL